MSARAYARTVMERADILACYSEAADCLTRRFGTPSLRQATETVACWMRAAGMTVRIDAIGNVRGRYPADRVDAPTLLLGSHLDTVCDAGKYDGPLGVLVALAVVERLHHEGTRLPFAIEVLGFADEEGVRFHTAYLGSAVVAGCFEREMLALVDTDGTPLADAIRSCGGDPEAIFADRRDTADLLGYLEVHIEQGPVLEASDLPVGVVAAISGQSRIALEFRGTAGHAGTVPMALRHDALCAAAEFVLAVERHARGVEGLVATVGQLAVGPGASNVIPGLASLSLDVRHADDDVRLQARAALHEQALRIAAERGVEATWRLVHESASVPCAGRLTELMAEAVGDFGYPVRRLPSGAGHDAVTMSRIAPVAMLFVRCDGGISHNPAENVRADDVAVAIDVLSACCRRIAAGLRDTTTSANR